ncbi:ANR family transcriptional regulator [Vibrio parahaemolyticus]|nr:ANR family transcriptional regulator [Vibrio parahaemolyticus]EIT7131652.1 ANR family transcriptional regulator [Vibrio parahaemolyticus]EIZ1368536.1 ANR family transcriptional regulator [Vibrio parahaemolyticus]EIZ4252147.1 ANR family transcriptional regulator [Vibrio parahaemolyticus]
MKKQYLELAQQACNAERRKDWELACNLWFQSIGVAYGMNRPWATARYEFVVIGMVFVHRLSFLSIFIRRISIVEY